MGMADFFEDLSAARTLPTLEDAAVLRIDEPTKEAAERQVAQPTVDTLGGMTLEAYESPQK